ncbi:Do family serine endopeptidase [Azospirillum rugosum]|uniref:Do/DeqQ family serine protease n=1 Tax=Azospirillum rugosum TaxID=416170 RepID=A0ABS4SP67_9PROT|nr:Do family serine endopeptidase [Azospirillum rugosum]MBP2294347.1 Do/DeqQ family serine protease [Azospirillum rugosum]MDQ0527682.1 Do/DeqQ family serine protease [Azospirillum rugosum]
MLRSLSRFTLLFVLLACATPATVSSRVSAQELSLPSLAPMLSAVTPGVVNIAVRGRTEMDNPLLRDPFFRRFFDLPERLQRETRAAGSGVIVDARNGYILTNNHVVENAEVIEVTTKDKRQFRAKLLGRDPQTEIAVLKIEASGLTAVPLGDSDRLEVGDYVVAIGNPFGLGQTVTSGIVSALGRSGLSEGYEDFIQTDASINPGNSGGALVDLRGRLVGINTAILAPSGGNIGIGFAVPINMARQVMDQILQYGEIRRGRIGVAVQDLTPEVASAMGVKEVEGAVVAQVEQGSPADRAGIRRGDIIVAIDGSPVRSATQVRNRVGLKRVGDRVELMLQRNGTQRSVTTRVEPAARS